MRMILAVVFYNSHSLYIIYNSFHRPPRRWQAVFQLSWNQSAFKQLIDNQRIINDTLLKTWITLARWQSAASSSPCFSAQLWTWAKRMRSLLPHSREHSWSLGSKATRLNSQMFMKWNNWENSCIVSAAFTRQRRNNVIAVVNTCKMLPATNQHNTLEYQWTSLMFIELTSWTNKKSASKLQWITT